MLISFIISNVRCAEKDAVMPTELPRLVLVLAVVTVTISDAEPGLVMP